MSECIKALSGLVILNCSQTLAENIVFKADIQPFVQN